MIRKIQILLKENTNNTLIQLFRYTFVGGAAFIVDFFSLFIFTEFLNLYYLISATIAFFIGLVTNYILSIVWVFHIRAFSSKSLEFGIFALIGITGLLLNILFIWFFTEQVHLYYLLSKIISAVFVYLWNFFARKNILFR